ncbi:phosphodiesterase [Adlercreutzia equolifaciens]|uniref:phosphodiesterase n=1 Tax=Adlercreutzia equolifaciens TaxID=446660 RepID=UPI0023B166CA|nr:phosphodiesterase [Adlercreutzia equolifaciens]MDE8702624.1 phosphodiesterase [Adlercreutzia equolifaciens]
MKLVIASDIHGSALFAKQLMDRVSAEQADRLVLLGDLLYHGPRNPLPPGYHPTEVAAMLNASPVPVVAVRGNCEAEVDQTLLDFPCMDTTAQIIDGNRTLMFSHGHVVSPENHPALPSPAALFTGHTHKKILEGRKGVWYVNPGSVSLPKDGIRSYATYEDGVFALKQLKDGEVLVQAIMTDLEA